MKAIACIMAWVVYCIVTVIYFGTYEWIEPMYSKLTYLGASVLLLCFCMYQILTPMGEHTKSFIVLCLSAITINMLFILIHHLFGMDSFKWKVIIFIGLELFTAASIYICGKKHGLFKND